MPGALPLLMMIGLAVVPRDCPSRFGATKDIAHLPLPLISLTSNGDFVWMRSLTLLGGHIHLPLPWRIPPFASPPDFSLLVPLRPTPATSLCDFRGSEHILFAKDNAGRLPDAGQSSRRSPGQRGLSSQHQESAGPCPRLLGQCLGDVLQQ